ncbi:damage-inducible protein DinB [Lichenibacterium minor]|uniref:Damage-inducible protein DinB n=1 Tax=Lichenibacterium minor TaxID=2316528 RepID=A0A4Q2UAM4_9HYPH|nr:DinB family protein [Lichenibacterium minor]RYC33018.1 damage-inducible protein DinB [Lichenibacterium minor]
MSDRLSVLARYNAWANHKLYDAVEALPDADRRADRGVAFHSLVGTLNHILVSDMIWMERLSGGSAPALRLDSILHDDFDALRSARGAEDTRIIGFVDGLDEAALRSSFTYRPLTLPGRYVGEVGPALDHMFNHQTHHRGQCHAVLTGLGAPAPALDLAPFYLEVGFGGLTRIA